MYHTLLVPLDGSKRAEAILPHVEELAQRYDAKVIFLQVIDLAPIVPTSEAIPLTLHQQELDRRKAQAEAYLAARQGEFREKGITAKTHVSYGAVVEAIINTAEREGVDLIAIASHGRSSLPQVFYGSVAAGVLHRVDRPLLLIRSQGDG